MPVLIMRRAAGVAGRVSGPCPSLSPGSDPDAGKRAQAPLPLCFHNERELRMAACLWRGERRRRSAALAHTARITR